MGISVKGIPLICFFPYYCFIFCIFFFQNGFVLCLYVAKIHILRLAFHTKGVGNGANFIHFLYKVLGKRSVEKGTFKKNPI